MIRALLPLVCLALLTPQPANAGDACPTIERTAGPPVYALLFGYPHDGPVEDSWLSFGTPRPDLPMVDDDLARMARFFHALGPMRMRIHGEPDRAAGARLSSFGVRPPTWRSLLESVAEVVADIDAADSESEPQIYIYLAGHGRQIPAPNGQNARLLFFGRPDGEAPGYNGYIHSALFAEHILTPLAARARVHLIADTCFSYVLLQTQGMKRTYRVIKAPSARAYEEAFGRTFPDVGAQLASRGATYEDGRMGGRFSHALRSAAIGPADTDGDGVITYAEMERALQLAARGDRHLFEPDVVAPGRDGDAPFLRWRQSPAARVCASPGAGQHLGDGPSLFATLPAFLRPTPLWLSPGHTFTVNGERFDATDGIWLPQRK